MCRLLVKELETLGARSLVSYGPLKRQGVRLLGSGWTGNVFLVETDSNQLLAVKALKPGSRRASMLAEAAAWAAAAALGATPRMVYASRLLIAYEPALGPMLRDYMPGSRAEAALVARRLVEKAYALDAAGLRHNELARPEGQVVLDTRSPPEPYIVDYDSATWGKGGRNLPQLIGGLHRTPLGRLCRAREVAEEARTLLKAYKRRPRALEASHVAGMLEEGCLRGYR